ncbi:MAG: hypothetical protein JSS62_05370 [Verrucomicrobia bacterium]|nr:hypothetical protein [Verrucomicrobiota bacterium]MBS0647275.1 hypothetical protein [Verrucomicrobiota bacterium]
MNGCRWGSNGANPVFPASLVDVKQNNCPKWVKNTAVVTMLAVAVLGALAVAGLHLPPQSALGALAGTFGSAGAYATLGAGAGLFMLGLVLNCRGANHRPPRKYERLYPSDQLDGLGASKDVYYGTGAGAASKGPYASFVPENRFTHASPYAPSPGGSNPFEASASAAAAVHSSSKKGGDDGDDGDMGFSLFD